nr:MAG TPA: hypothetical protein [Caudoviricetes sp.]
MDTLRRRLEEVCRKSQCTDRILPVYKSGVRNY